MGRLDRAGASSLIIEALQTLKRPALDHFRIGPSNIYLMHEAVLL